MSYVHTVTDNQRRKQDAKAHKAIFVGYPPDVKGYKLYDLEKKFVVCRDVQFFEDNFDILKGRLSQSRDPMRYEAHISRYEHTQ